MIGEVCPDAETARKNSNRKPEFHRERTTPAAAIGKITLVHRKSTPSRHSSALP
jgi:hypothetical protein